MVATVLGLPGVTSVIVVGELRLAAEVEEEARLEALSIVYIVRHRGIKFNSEAGGVGV